jgi:DNA-binding NarL/FixJ family response regulator
MRSIGRGGSIIGVKTVVIVDDHAGFRDLARELLEGAGYSVVGEAEDGASAVAAVRALRPDAVLLDINLPDRDGFAVAEALARAERPPRVVLTSSEEAAAFGPLPDGPGVLRFVPKSELASTSLDSLWDGPADED